MDQVLYPYDFLVRRRGLKDVDTIHDLSYVSVFNGQIIQRQNFILDYWNFAM